MPRIFKCDYYSSVSYKLHQLLARFRNFEQYFSTILSNTEIFEVQELYIGNKISGKETFEKISMQTRCDICIKMTCIMKRYYAINRILLSCIGLWPYQSNSYRYVLIAFITVILYSSVTFQVWSFHFI